MTWQTGWLGYSKAHLDKPLPCPHKPQSWGGAGHRGAPGLAALAVAPGRTGLSYMLIQAWTGALSCGTSGCSPVKWKPGLPLRGWSWDFMWEGMWGMNYCSGSLGVKSRPDAALQMIQDGRMLPSRWYRMTFFRTLSDLALDCLASFFLTLLTNPLQVAVPTIKYFIFHAGKGTFGCF